MNTGIKKYLLIILSATLLIISFPKFDLSLCAWIGLVPLFIAIKNENNYKRLLSGFLFGFIFFYGTLYWINASIILYGDIQWYLSIFIVAILIAYLALFMSLFTFLLPILSRSLYDSNIIAAPLLFVSLEHLRGWFFTGFGFSSLGYSQSNFLPIIQISDITGHYGVTFIIVMVNAAIYAFFFEQKTKKEKVRIVCFTTIIMIFTLVYGYYKLNVNHQSGTIRSSIVQPDIPQDEKNEAAFKKSISDDCIELSLQTEIDKPELIVWPESATGTLFKDSFSLQEKLVTATDRLKCDILLGSIGTEVIDEKKKIYNTAYHISEHGKLKGTYDKIHLLPFGEYMPLEKIFFFISRMVPAISDFTPGKEYKIFELSSFSQSKQKRFAVTICYEAIFPNLVRKFVKRDADFLVNISNDAWFGDTAGPFQHFNINIFRAIENRTPIIRSANTGVSGFIDKKGRTMKRTSLFTRETIFDELEIRVEMTFYTRYGDIFSYFCILITLYGIIKFKLKRKSNF
jgi:apolipoprotein N-acyltransferase